MAFFCALIFSGGFAEGRGRFFDVEKIVNDLEGPADEFAETAEARDVFVVRAAGEGSGDDGSANKRGGFRAMNVFELGGVDLLAFGFDVRDLAADHAVHGAGGVANFGDDANAAIGRDVGVRERFEGESEQAITGENGHSDAEFFVAGGLAAAKIVVVEGGQVVVNQRISVNEFEGAADGGGGVELPRKKARGFVAENRADAFASGENAVAHGLMNCGGTSGFGRQKFFEGALDNGLIVSKERGRRQCRLGHWG